jgi:lysophospholipase L1-like esterase
VKDNFAQPAQSRVVPPSTGKRIVFKVATALISTIAAAAVLLAADLYLHHRHGINVWGYRGPAVGRKQPGEKRIAILGGSTTWGYGLGWKQSFPAQLQRQIQAQRGSSPGGSVTVLNLGFNNEGAYSFKYTLNDYAYLDYDLVVFYGGYNDLGGLNFAVSRDQSPIFRWTGYMPLLPSFAVAKIYAWKGSSNKEGKQTVFVSPGSEPNQSEPTREQTAKSLAQQLGRLTDAGRRQSTQATCAGQWQFYCQQMYEAINLALSRGKRVVVVTEPYISDGHVEQQQALANMLNERLAGRADLVYVNLGQVVDLHDGSLCWDGMHLTEEGNRRIAEAIAQPVLDVLHR